MQSVVRVNSPMPCFVSSNTCCSCLLFLSSGDLHNEYDGVCSVFIGLAWSQSWQCDISTDFFNHCYFCHGHCYNTDGVSKMANRIDWRIRVWSIDSICIERVCANTRPHPSKHNPTWRWCTWYAHKHTTRTTVYDLESILSKVFRRSKYNIKSSIIYLFL